MKALDRHHWETKALLSGETIKLCAICGVKWRFENEDFNCRAQRCKKCGGELRRGHYLAQTYTGTPDFIGSAEVVTLSWGGGGVLVKDGCLKCVDCGWSVAG